MIHSAIQQMILSRSTFNKKFQPRPYWHWMIKIQKSIQKDQFDFLGASLLALEQPGYAAKTPEERLAGAF